MKLLNLKGITSLRNLIFLIIVGAEILLTARMAFAASSSDSVLIGGTGPADSKAQLDVKSTTKGVLLPRMTTTQQNAISSPTEGLLIYDNVLHQLANYNGSSWIAVGGGSGTISGPVSSTNNGIAVWNGTGGTVLKDSSVTISGTTITGSLTGIASGNLSGTPSNHGMLISSGTNAVTILAPDASTTKVWTSGGTGADPSWQSPTGGFTSPLTTLGDTMYENASPAAARLAGNTTTTKKYYSQTGTGTISAVPAWAQVGFADVSGTVSIVQGGLGADNSATAGVPLFDGVGGITVGSTIPTAFGGTNINTYVLGDLLYSSAAQTLSKLGGNITSTKKFLNQTGTGAVSAAPAWAALVGADLPNPSASTLGGIKSIAAVTSQWINSISTSGVPSLTQPAFSDISGTASLTTQVTGVLPIANGGTNNASLAVTAGGVPYTDGSKIVNVGAGSSGQVLKSNGASAPSWGAVAGSAIPTVIDTLTSGTTYNLEYYFTITSGNATLASTYTNNGVTFTTHATVASSTSVVMSGSGPPTASGTLTKSGGTGDATLTFSAFNTPIKLHIRMAGGGAGGTGSGTVGGTAATAGNQSTFGSSLLTAGGGAVGSFGNAGGLGGTCTVASPAEGFGIVGGQGMSGGAGAATGYRFAGGNGGNTPFFGGGGALGNYSNAGSAGVANTGGGGQGGGSNAVANGIAGSGGGSGCFIDAWINTPLSATYAYVIGATAAAGGLGTSGIAGSAGAAGIIVVESVY